VVKGKNCVRGIELEYSFDRLSAEKIIQAYQLLVPERVWKTVCANGPIRGQAGDGFNEVGSDLRESVLGSAKRGTYDW
jgi:hypothetical protein